MLALAMFAQSTVSADNAEPLPSDDDSCCGPADECEVCR